MLVVIGDLVEDVVVRLDRPIRPATDTVALIARRRGGSAANVAATAARLGRPARFLGQVGDDVVGRALTAELQGEGVDVSWVAAAGRTGTIVVLVDRDGERTMLTDRGACDELSSPDPAWLDGADVLHVPLYSFAGGELATTATTLVRWAHDRSVAVSIDLSSVALMEALGDDTVRGLLRRTAPSVVLANVDEARCLRDLDVALGATVVEHGPTAALVRAAGHDPVSVPTVQLDHPGDTTGAGDAFAAGFLTWRSRDDPATAWREDPVAACRAAHRAAADLLVARGGTARDDRDDHDAGRGSREERDERS